MCGQTDTKFLDMCGQTDTKFLPTEKVETGLKKERRRRRKKKSRNIMSPTFIGLGDIIDTVTRSYEWHGCHPVYGSNFNNASYERSWMVDLESQNPG